MFLHFKHDWSDWAPRNVRTSVPTQGHDKIEHRPVKGTIEIRYCFKCKRKEMRRV